MPPSNLKIILASRSPRRRQLLEEAGYDFEVRPSEVDEPPGICTNCGPAEFVTRLATQKAADVVARLQREGHTAAEDRLEVVVGCDTVGEVGGRILTKPIDRDNAREMLTLLSGTEHRVFSGLCVWPLGGKVPAPAEGETPTSSVLLDAEPAIDVAISTLQMERLEGDELEAYLDSGLWEDKAAALGFQDRPGWIQLVSGSGSNVVGLPMELLAETLEAVVARSGDRAGNDS
ncbi:MAG: Maf-like protein [Planctomycetota bacterium]|nr:MAG: Maf-like protein [Planctomycetota bacterium]REK40850.1 MAG: Maf-like protein [Planctomycetota bacterium]